MSTDSDRRVRQADRLARILKVLEFIQSRGQWNAQAIPAELEVTERTVYRDLQALNFAGVPWIYDDEAKSYRVRSDYRFAVPNLTDQELLGQAMATAITQSSGLDVGGGAGPTTRKIAATVSEERKQLLADAEQVVTVLGLQLADHRAHREMIQTVQLALIHKQRLVGVYRTRIVHLGERLEQIIPKAQDRSKLFYELQAYLKPVLDHMVRHSDTSYQEYMLVRDQPFTVTGNDMPYNDEEIPF